jgi:phosphoribosyl-ATP pyrophosphohydrolase
VTDKHALDRLAAVIDARRSDDPDKSYTAKLLAKGTAVIAKKLGEEAVEVVIASVEGDRSATIRESADLLYHWLVLLASLNIPMQSVFDELDNRHGLSGLDEKASRS